MPSALGLRRGESLEAVDRDVQVLAEGAHRGGGVLKIVVQVEAVVGLGLLGLLGCCLEELGEAFQEPVGRFQNVIDELGCLVERLGGVEPVGQVQDDAAVDVVACGVGGGAGLGS